MQKFDSLFKSKNIFFIVIIIFVLSSFTLYHNRFDIFKLFKSENKDFSQIPENITLEEKESALLSSTKSLLNYVSSLKFPEAPANLVEPKLETMVNSASFEYKEQGERPMTNGRAMSDDAGEWRSIDHINYLLNVNLLVYNFMQDKDYSKELRIVKSRLLPQDIRNILNNLEAYNNNYLFSKSSSTEVIFPTNHKWLAKFIKIEKKPSAMMIKERDKALILGKLNYLIDFLYSEKFVREFINKDV